MDYCKSCDIAYEERSCPLCEARDKIAELEKDLEYEKDRE